MSKEWFYTVTQSMVSDLQLKGTELALFAVLNGFSQEGNGCYYGTRGRLAEMCGVKSRITIDTALHSLIQKGLIERFTAPIKGEEKVCYSVLPEHTIGVQKLYTPYSEIIQGEGLNFKHNNIQDNKNNNKSIVFKAPGVQEIAEYCRERGNRIDPQYFFDKMESVGWTLKSGQKVKDWKAVIRTWEKYDNNSTAPIKIKTLSLEDIAKR